VSRDTRASTLGVNTSAPRLEQNPSGTVAQSGRQIAGLVYAGILASNPVAPVGGDGAWTQFDGGELAMNTPGTIQGGDGGWG
jgi:hypothetical protein